MEQLDLIEIGAAFVAVVIAWSARKALAKWARDALRSIARQAMRALADYRVELAPLGLGLAWLGVSASAHGLAALPLALVPAAFVGAREVWRRRARWARSWPMAAKWVREYLRPAGLELLPWYVAAAASGWAGVWALWRFSPLVLGYLAALVVWTGFYARHVASVGRTRIARRLRKDRWREIMTSYKLEGLRRGRVEHGPDSIKVHVHLHKGMVASAVESKLAHLETALGGHVGSARLERRHERSDRAVLHLSLAGASGQVVAWAEHELAERLPDEVTIAATRQGVPVMVNPRQHILVAGQSDAGKSVVYRNLLAPAAVAVDVRTLFVDMKEGVEAGLWRGLVEAITDGPAACEATEWVFTEMKRRLGLLRERRETAWTATPDDPTIVFHVDEAAEYFRVLKAAKLMDTFTTIAEQARAADIRLWLATQYPKASVLPTEITMNFSCTIGLRVRRSTESDVIFGQGSVKEGWNAHRLPEKGWMLVRDRDHDEPVPARSGWVSEQHVLALKPFTATSAPAAPVPAQAPAAEVSQTAAALVIDPREKLRLYVEAAGAEGVSVFELAQLVGRKTSWIYAKLAEDVAAGRAATPSRGLYAWAEPQGESGTAPAALDQARATLAELRADNAAHREAQLADFEQRSRNVPPEDQKSA